jgi:hypothetical protein
MRCEHAPTPLMLVQTTSGEVSCMSSVLMWVAEYVPGGSLYLRRLPYAASTRGARYGAARSSAGRSPASGSSSARYSAISSSARSSE